MPPAQSPQSQMPLKHGVTPWSPFSNLREEMDQLFGRYLPARLGHLWDSAGEKLAGMAPLDVSESADDIEISIDVPGMKEQDIDVTIADEMLTIKGTRKNVAEEKKAEFHRIERSFGSFLRRVALPCAVDEANIKATLHDGVLHVQLPKSKEAKSRETRIAVNHG